MEFILVWFACGIICAVVAGNKGRSQVGHFFLGLLLGPIGVLFSIVLPSNKKQIELKELQSGLTKKCPMCAELIKSEANKCRYCNYEFPLIETEHHIIQTVINPKNIRKKIALCSCGKKFTFHKNDEGKLGTCPGCNTKMIFK